MSHYDYDKFVHPVPEGHTIPKGTPMRSVMSGVETFFTAKYDLSVYVSNPPVKYYLTYDITAPKPPTKINSVIYNVRTTAGIVFPVAVYQGDSLWSGFSVKGKLGALYSLEIESFDTTPPEEEAGGDDE